MQVASRRDAEGVVHLAVAGEIDMASAARLDTALGSAVTAADVARVVVDFAGVTFCDSSGLAALDRAYAMTFAAGVRLRLVNVRPAVRRVLELTGMYDTLTR